MAVESAFLFHLTSRFEPAIGVYCLLSTEGQIFSTDWSLLSERPEILISYDVGAVVQAFRLSSARLPRTLIDVGDVLRLRSQLSKDQGGERYWDIWRSGIKHFTAESDHKKLKEISEARVPWPPDASVKELLASGAAMLRGLWTELTEDLASSEELQRFYEVELPIRQIFNFREYAGIKVNLGNLETFLQSCTRQKYTAFRGLATVLGFSPIGITPRKLAAHLTSTDASHLHDMLEKDQWEDYLDIAQENSEFARLLTDYSRSGRGLSALNQIIPVDERIYPHFQCHGTVTSRILVTSPRLQEIRREHRGAVQADEGKVAVYLDYSQYEPGIVASLSNDQGLIAAYNSSDLYAELAELVLRDRAKRDVAKKIFLAFCYGMSKHSIARLLMVDHPDAEGVRKCENLIGAFFDQFPQLEAFRQRTANELEEKGFVSTIMGNRRKRRFAGALLNKEKRWAMSQVVQGTGSLIFKEALVGLVDVFGSDAVLLPVHDAVLLQFDPEKVTKGEFVAEASEILRNSFARRCPSIQPKVAEVAF